MHGLQMREARCGIVWHGVVDGQVVLPNNEGDCEGDIEMRPLIYRDTLRQGQAEQMWHIDTVVILRDQAEEFPLCH